MGEQDGEDRRETWREWVQWSPHAPDPPLLTRDEVLATVERLGVQPPVDARTLRYWEREGLLPRPTLAHHAGATRTRYPWWVADLILQIRRYQHRGFSNAQLRGRVRAEAHRLALDPWPRPSQRPASPGDQPDPVAILDAELADLTDPPRPPTGPPFEAPVLPETVARQLAALLAALRAPIHRRYGVAATHVEVRFVAADGDALTFHIPADGSPWPPEGEGREDDDFEEWIRWLEWAGW